MTVIACLLLALRLAAAAEPEPSLSAEAAAVAKAVASDDAEGLQRLARLEGPDPWRVADELAAAGAFDAAFAFARALGDARLAAGDRAEGVAALRKAAAIAERIGRLEAAAEALRDAGRAAYGADDLDVAEAVWMGRLALEARRSNASGRAETSRDLALTSMARGAYAPALARLEVARVLHADAGNGVEEAIDRDLSAQVHLAMGDPAPAQAHAARALALLADAGRPRLEGRVLCRLAEIHAALLDESEALGLLDRAFEVGSGIEDVELRSAALSGMGDIYLVLDEQDDARTCFERALALSRGADDACEARALLGLAEVRRRAGGLRAALALQEKALSLCRENGSPRGAVKALASMALTRRYLGDLEGAQALYARAQEEATRIRARDLVVRMLWGSAEAHLCGGNRTGAVDQARQAISDLPRVLGGLSEEQGAAARSRHAGMFEVGARAALELGDLDRLCFFLESGRAGTLLEFLRQREALQAVLVSKELLDAEAAARGREAEALERYREVRDRGGRHRIRASRQALDVARAELKEVIERIQREAKAKVGALTPPPASLERIQGWVGDSETLVLYGLYMEESLALVIGPGSTRAVRLGPTKTIAKAFQKFLLDDPEEAPEAALKRLRALVVTPLGLGEEVRRVLVSPDGVLSYAPFAPLWPEREVVCVPSGTTLGLLLREKDKRGKGVLALGDPVYDTNVDPTVTSSVRSGVDLLPLPFTREEALAVGDVVLLGSEATEAGLRYSVGKRPRWRAVHIACHGVMDPDKPTLSALALTTDGRDDGFLTALDVFRLEVPADLVVLSACDSGVGRIVNAEGVLGLMRAFLFAGAPRVIVSLGRVDDGATRALMEELYRQWNAGADAATALKRAQAFVRDQEAWRHPHYWANWVLWGLGD